MWPAPTPDSPSGCTNWRRSDEPPSVRSPSGPTDDGQRHPEQSEDAADELLARDREGERGGEERGEQRLARRRHRRVQEDGEARRARGQVAQEPRPRGVAENVGEEHEEREEAPVRGRER